jgi:predicted murein hydrolase (TIGR00659 family)
MQMTDFFENSIFFGVIISLVSYGIGVLLKKKFKSPLLNPLLISIIITIAVLLILGIDYNKYYEGAKYISYLLTPATVCLAIPLYEQIELLKHNFKAIITGILSGVVTSLCTILALAAVFGFSHEEYVTFLPKSITTAIGMGVSEELGGYVPITAAVIIITGVTGNIFAELIFRLFRIHEPVAKGIALGSASHAIGTAKAMEIGEIEGAMSSLSIVVSGIITVAGASVFANFY